MKKVTISLNRNSIEKAVKDVRAYSEYIRVKSYEFCLKLAQKGYETAINNVGMFDGVQFKITEEDNKVYLIGFSYRQTRQWYNARDGYVTSVDYSPIFMAEFGSGRYAPTAQTLEDGKRVGRGTYPTQDGKPSKGLREAWGYRLDESQKEPTITHGEKPTKPMLRARNKMLQTIKETAQEVFG